jgi:subtilisin family serine protease
LLNNNRQQEQTGESFMRLLRAGIVAFRFPLHFVSLATRMCCTTVFVTAVCCTEISPSEAAANDNAEAVAAQAAAPAGGNPLTQFDALTAKAQSQGPVPVLLRLDVNFQTEGTLSSPDRVTQRNAIANAQNVVLQSLAGRNPTNVKTYRFVPYMALTVNAAALQALANNPMVTGIIEDVPVPPTMAESTGVVGADAAWAAGYDGSGWAVAVLDTGVDKNHNFLAGKVISEACYSTTNALYSSTSLCPGGVASTTATDSGLNCPVGTDGCQHGTHVSGTVAGMDYTPNGPGYNGVARGANIIAIQVFSRFTGSTCTNLGLSSPCALTYTSDQIAGLERVYALRSSFNIAAANMSLGGDQYLSNCDGDSRKPIIDNLRAAGIATVIASGNSGYKTAMGAPACISTAISVGATCDSATAGFGCNAVDDVPSYSNIAPFISLLAPGSLISSSVPGTNTFASWHGTSMATPHVAGAWALMKQRLPSATVTEILDALQTTGTLVDDQRVFGSVTGMRRINVGNALAALLPPIPAPTFIYPAGGEALPAGATINVTWETNGAPPASTYDLAYRDHCTPDFSDDMENGGGLWNVSHGAGSRDWTLAAVNPHGGASAWFASDPATPSDQYLATASALTVPPNGQLSFWHSFNMEAGFDGGVVEISTDGAVWTDLGPLMTQGGYNSTISTCCNTPIAGRVAFSGNSGGYIETLVDLGSYAGQSVYIRFRMASDEIVAANGWYVDDVSLQIPSPWIPIGTSAAGASSLSWAIPLATGNDYCLSIQAMAPGYPNSPQVISAPFGVVVGDSDGDGISDADELILGTNPNSVDSDGDGLVDGVDGVVPVSAYPGGVDLDSDGFVDGEQGLGTDPTLSNIGDVAPRGALDNQINLGDILVLTRLVTGVIQATALEAVLGDINRDGQLNAADVLLLQQAALNGTAP